MVTDTRRPETPLERAERAERERLEREEQREQGTDPETLARLRHLRRLRWLMSTPKGRAIAWGILDANHLLKHTVGNPIDRVNNVDGQRSFALKFLGDLKEASPDNVPTMLKENWIDGDHEDE